MGMLIEGRWVDEAQGFINDGAFVRETSTFDVDLAVESMRALDAEPGRFRLIVSLSCPWSHQTLLVRAAKGLDRSLPVAFAGGPRIQGYAIRDEESPGWSGVNDGDRNPHGIVAEAPSVDWSARHDRARLGPAQVWFEATGPATVEIGELESVQWARSRPGGRPRRWARQ